MVNNNPFNISSVPSQSVVRELKQTGKRISIKRDAGRPAKLPGKRVSALGNVYWETRKNRSDSFGKSI